MDRLGPKAATLKGRHFLRAWRKHRGLTQDTVAARIAEFLELETLDRSRISKIERGIDALEEYMQHAFANALHIPIGWIWVSPEVALQEHETLETIRDYPPDQVAAMLQAIRSLNRAS